MEFFTADIAWLLLAYVLGTAFGWYQGLRVSLSKTSEAVIDSLIEQGYLKTRGYGESMEILKHEEWCDDQNSN
jgi:hypothetical protein